MRNRNDQIALLNELFVQKVIKRNGMGYLDSYLLQQWDRMLEALQSSFHLDLSYAFYQMRSYGGILEHAQCENTYNSRLE